MPYTPIELLQLPERVSNALIKNKIGCVEELKRRAPEQIFSLKGIGVKAYEQIMYALDNYKHL